MSSIIPETINDQCQTSGGTLPKWLPKIELDQLVRPPLEIRCKMSSITPGTRLARYLREFISPNMSPRRGFGGLKLPS